MNQNEAIERALKLPIWKEPTNIVVLSGGITNHNIKLSDGGKDYVVRVGGDIPVHQVMRFNELACHTAAHAAGLSPKIVHVEPGMLAMEFIEGTSLTEEGMRAPGMVERVVPLLKSVHRDGLKNLRGPVLMFWVFHVIRDYAANLERSGSSYTPDLPGLLKQAEKLEEAVGPVDIVLGHNDLLPANILDTGERLWLIDWDYGGLNSPLFDLAGLASNSGLEEGQETLLLETYFESVVTPELWRAYSAMKCASLMRETMWSMISEIHSEIDFNYVAYTAENRSRLNAALQDFDCL